MRGFLHIDPADAVPIWRQIEAGVSRLIASRALQPGMALEEVARRPDALAFHWLDLASLLGVGGVYLAVVFYRMSQASLVPVGDPRLQRSLRLQNA